MCMYVCMCVCMYVCMCVYIYIYMTCGSWARREALASIVAKIDVVGKARSLLCYTMCYYTVP